MKLKAFQVSEEFEGSRVATLHVHGTFVELMTLVAQLSEGAELRFHAVSHRAPDVASEPVGDPAPVPVVAQPSKPIVDPVPEPVTAAPAPSPAPRRSRAKAEPAPPASSAETRPVEAAPPPSPPDRQMELPVTKAVVAVTETPKVFAAEVEGMPVQVWKEGIAWIAQVEVGQPPSYSGVSAKGADKADALGALSKEILRIRAAKDADDARAAQAAAVAAETPVAPAADLPTELVSATTFRQVMTWLLDPKGGGYKLTDRDAIKARCLELRPHVFAISRLSGDLGERVDRALELFALDHAQAKGAPAEQAI